MIYRHAGTERQAGGSRRTTLMGQCPLLCISTVVTPSIPNPRARGQSPALVPWLAVGGTFVLSGAFFESQPRIGKGTFIQGDLWIKIPSLSAWGYPRFFFPHEYSLSAYDMCAQFYRLKTQSLPSRILPPTYCPCLWPSPGWRLVQEMAKSLCVLTATSPTPPGLLSSLRLLR